MAELFVLGPDGTESFHRELTSGEKVRIGRAPRDGWAVPWDRCISREHADLVWDGSTLTVHCLPTAANPILLRGERLRDGQFEPGEKFRIGDTRFEVIVESVERQTAILNERAYRHEDLERYEFRDTKKQMELLGRLPEILDACRSDEDVAARLVEMLLDSVPDAEAVAVLHYDLPQDYADAPVTDLEEYESTFLGSIENLEGSDEMPFRLDKPKMMRVATRDEYTGRFQPSRRLSLSALLRDETVVHLWGDGTEEAKFTMSEDLNWAFCVPIRAESCRGWCLYVAGSGDSSERELGGDLRFAELLAQFLGSIRQVRSLEAKTTRLSQFFSPSLVKSLGSDAALEPREADLGILFCDVRGFTRISERSRHDLKDLLNRISCALTLMTQAILENDGAIADFQGDAALGFWGWPIASEEDPIRTCRAALRILRDFGTAAGEPGGPLEGFRVGIGISYGMGVAGKIGSAEQAQLTVLGHTVNLGARLEGLTKKFGVPILVDAATAAAVARLLPESEAVTRRLGVVQPAGMESSVEVHELIPANRLDRAFTPQHIADHRAAVEAFVEGRWSESFDLFANLPDADRARNLPMAHMARLDYTPPPDWNGVIAVESK